VLCWTGDDRPGLLFDRATRGHQTICSKLHAKPKAQ